MGTTRFAVALVVMVIAAIITIFVDVKEFTNPRKVEIERLLKQLNKPALKSIKSDDGDIIDCVEITRQPAFDHPLLKNHTIQMRPSLIPEEDSMNDKEHLKAITQVWHKNGECPENTIPIRRIKKEDILRAKSIDSFAKKTSPNILEVTSSNQNPGHEYAYMGGSNGKDYGTKASINIWNPKVEVPTEFSLAQIWLVSGVGSTLNTIEAGWQVYPHIYGDSSTRLFVYWTRDGYQKTGCYNLVCPGFVQTSTKFSVGGAYSTVSQYGGVQLDLNLFIWKDQQTGNWWLKIDSEFIGYWPGSLFDSLGNGATAVKWGGEIVSVSSGRHTTTNMGSGHFAYEGFTRASYVKNLKIVDGTNTLREPENLYAAADNSNCYSVKPGSVGTSFGTHFFFGGPGRNPNCL